MKLNQRQQSQKQQKIWLKIISQLTLFCFLFSLWQPVYASFTPNSPITESTPHNTAESANERTLNLTLDLAALTLEANELTNQNPNTSLDNEPISPLENHLQNELKSAFSENSPFTTQTLGISEKNINSDIELRAFCQKMNVGGLCQSTDPILASFMGDEHRNGVYQPKNLGLYSYVHNNPVNAVDPDGKDIFQRDRVDTGDHLKKASQQNVGQAKQAASAGNRGLTAWYITKAAVLNLLTIGTDVANTPFEGYNMASGFRDGNYEQARNSAVSLLTLGVGAKVGLTTTKSLPARRVFSSSDKYVGELAEAIEMLRPGSVKGVNQPINRSNGSSITDADIMLNNGVIIQVKSGGGKGINGQIARTEAGTGQRTVGYVPDASSSAQVIKNSNGKVTNSLSQLMEMIK